MITFYNDTLAPPELCKLLYQIVPVEYHVPVRFHNRFHTYTDHLGREHYPTGSAHLRRTLAETYIDINLNPVYDLGCGRYNALSTGLWRVLLEVCLHEFGHVITWPITTHLSHYEYAAEPYGRVQQHIEQLADDWENRLIKKIMERDPRLGQPRRLTGYFGARLARWNIGAKQEKRGSAYAAYVSEMRCRRTGGQLTAGDVLKCLGIPPWKNKNAYVLLRQISTNVGIDYVDEVHRHHKLYTWGDMPTLAERLRDVE